MSRQHASGSSFCVPRRHAIVHAAHSVEGDKMTIGRFAHTAIGVAMVAALMLAAGGLARAEDSKLTIMVFPGMQNLALFAAQSKGLFAKRGLAVDIKMAPSSDEQRAGLADGRWQIIHAGID